MWLLKSKKLLEALISTVTRDVCLWGFGIGYYEVSNEKGGRGLERGGVDTQRRRRRRVGRFFSESIENAKKEILRVRDNANIRYETLSVRGKKMSRLLFPVLYLPFLPIRTILGCSDDFFCVSFFLVLSRVYNRTSMNSMSAERNRRRKRKGKRRRTITEMFFEEKKTKMAKKGKQIVHGQATLVDYDQAQRNTSNGGGKKGAGSYDEVLRGRSTILTRQRRPQTSFFSFVVGFIIFLFLFFLFFMVGFLLSLFFILLVFRFSPTTVVEVVVVVVVVDVVLFFKR